MADDPSKKGALRTGLVSAQAKTTKYAIGLQKFSVSPERLKAAVKKVGNSAKRSRKSGREGVEGRRGFIVADRHRYTDIEDYLVGLTLGQVRSLMHGVAPHMCGQVDHHCWTEGPGVAPPDTLLLSTRTCAEINGPASESNSMTRRGTCSTCLPETA